MPQVINTNVMSLTSQRALNSSQNALTTAMSRLSSGLRVNSAKDDAAGIVIAESQTTQIRGMTVAMRNANDGMSLAQTAEGAIGQVNDAFQRMRELAVQSSNGTYTSTDRINLNTEFTELGKEVNRILAGTEFNGLKVTGADAGVTTFQVGANNTTNDQITVTTVDLSADAGVTLATAAVITGTGATASLAAIDLIDTALENLGTERATYGAIQNRFETAISNLQVSSENQTAARSRIVDADFAAETAEMTRGQILQQAGVAMLSQANQLPQGVLSLLR